MLEVLTNICEGKGKEGDIELLEEMGEVIKDASLCGLGQTAPNPVLTTLRYFNLEKCIGCGLCLKACPADAISGEKKQPHKLDQDKCIQCGFCYEICKFKAIVKK